MVSRAHRPQSALASLVAAFGLCGPTAPEATSKQASVYNAVDPGLIPVWSPLPQPERSLCVATKDHTPQLDPVQPKNKRKKFKENKITSWLLLFTFLNP